MICVFACRGGPLIVNTTYRLSDALTLFQTRRLEKNANIADPVQTPQNAASDQVLHYLLTGISIPNIIKVKTFTTGP